MCRVVFNSANGRDFEFKYTRYGDFNTIGDFRSWAVRKFRLPGMAGTYLIFADGVGQYSHACFSYPKHIDLDSGCHKFSFGFLITQTLGHCFTAVTRAFRIMITVVAPFSNCANLNDLK